MKGLVVAGTDTGVGKTAVSSNLVRLLREKGLRVGAYKPAASGAVGAGGEPRWDDVETLFSSLGGEYPRERICPQTFRAALAPPVAAREEGRSINEHLLLTGVEWWREKVDVLVVEGAGGLLSPLSDTMSVADLVRHLGFPLLIVARAGLGTINHTLLTLEAAESRGLKVLGIVLNSVDAGDLDDPSLPTNAAELRKRTRVPVLGVVGHCPGGDLLQDPAFRRIEWQKLFQEG